MTETEWMTSDNLSVLRQCLFRNVDPVSSRKVRLFVAACCRRIWPLLTDERSRRAVETAEVLADGGLSSAEASDCRRAAKEVGTEFSRSRPAAGVAMAARAAAETMAPSRQEAGRASDHAATAVASARYYGTDSGGGRPIADWYQAIDAERREQVPLFRDIFGNPFRPVAFDPRWRTADVTALARGIYEDRAFDRLPLLADALMDAGCDSEEILAHCRGEGPHVRGCWVVDLAINKE